jgi:hypothetical protein
MKAFHGIDRIKATSSKLKVSSSPLSALSFELRSELGLRVRPALVPYSLVTVTKKQENLFASLLLCARHFGCGHPHWDYWIRLFMFGLSPHSMYNDADTV